MIETCNNNNMYNTPDQYDQTTIYSKTATTTKFIILIYATRMYVIHMTKQQNKHIV